MKMIIFDLYGRFAHFRKFYTNSSSLSYSVPPRTTIEGIIAALLGYERDSYYDLLDVDKLNVAVRKIGESRKVMQSLNYIKADSPGKLNFPKEHTQIPFEILTADKNIRYRLYVNHENVDVLKEIEERTMQNRPVFPLYFGSAPFSCYIEYVDKAEWNWSTSDQYKIISSVINSEKVEEIDIESVEGSLLKERMPRSFGENRTIKEVTTYVYEESGQPLKVKFSEKYCELSNGENIIFL
ncbi:type I-B CRISPR-associated protein Cas5b [Sporanaerobacter acetigenes]|uniref:CRISPR-associated protein, Cas5h family n=2 Tax=Sporanaerobacter acetigenes TaxID=165813 RepID=A0A1M5YYZ8_9FIRM|nr:CRISPR-associated protein, Cas5h family [Sporanaerobacter acetigenes DSM 13106]